MFRRMAAGGGRMAAGLAALGLGMSFGPALAELAHSGAMPHVVQSKGRYGLIVDGAPFLVLGAQVNNSSNWPSTLPKVWPAIADIKANTVLVPAAWSQIEPVEGRFDFSFIDLLIAQAREHKVRVALLWFGTWKNNGPNYAPDWVKLDNKRFPRVITQDGKVMNSLSAVYPATLEADRRAFTALMRHLRQVDGDRHTVIMVQVENETGVYGAVRDYSPAAEALFAQPIPAEVSKATGRSGTWRDAFGRAADETFYAWEVARFVDQVAASGKAQYALPMYANAALRSLGPQDPLSFSSGGPTFDVLPIWKAATPHLDLIAPDIYNPDYDYYTETLKQYGGSDNALYVAETGNAPAYARYLFSALGAGAIGFSPFGIDFTGYANFPLGAARIDAQALEPFAVNYDLVAPLQQDLAALSLAGKLWGVSEPTSTHQQEIALSGGWAATVSYGRPQFGTEPPVGNAPASGGALIAELAPNQFLVTGVHCRVDLHAADKTRSRTLMSRVEEGRFENGRWIFEREWNGDQTDYGLNFASGSQVLKVTLTSY